MSRMETFISDDGSVTVYVYTDSADVSAIRQAFAEYSQQAMQDFAALEETTGYILGGIGLVVGILLCLTLMRRW